MLKCCQNIQKRKTNAGTSLGVHWLRLRVFSVGDTGLIPALGPNIPHAMWYGPEEKKIIETSGKIFPASVEEIISFLFKRVNHSDG